MKVILNPAEMSLAELVGRGRNSRRQAEGVTNKGTFGGVALADDHHVVGAMGELAFAKLCNYYPSGLWLDKDQDNDVSGIQVRTRRKDFMELYIFKKDPMDAFYALMTGLGPSFTYRGMIHAKDACLPEFWTPRGKNGGFPKRECWVIPPSALDVTIRP